MAIDNVVSRKRFGLIRTITWERRKIKINNDTLVYSGMDLQLNLLNLSYISHVEIF